MELDYTSWFSGGLCNQKWATKARASGGLFPIPHIARFFLAFYLIPKTFLSPSKYGSPKFSAPSCDIGPDRIFRGRSPFSPLSCLVYRIERFAPFSRSQKWRKTLDSVHKMVTISKL